MVKGQKNDRSVYNPHLYTKTKIFFPVKSVYLFEMLRGLQLQLFILYNYKFKLYYEKFAAPSECFSLSKSQKNDNSFDNSRL